MKKHKGKGKGNPFGNKGAVDVEGGEGAAETRKSMRGGKKHRGKKHSRR